MRLPAAASTAGLPAQPAVCSRTCSSTRGTPVRFPWPCSGVNVSVWCANTAGRPEQLALPLAVAVGALDYYANYSATPQPLTKFDLVAVPGKGGAMENWGLLMFDETRCAAPTPCGRAWLQPCGRACRHAAAWAGLLCRVEPWCPRRPWVTSPPPPPPSRPSLPRFLFNPATGGAWELWRVVDVVCHEVGHQWFGNLATAETWVGGAGRWAGSWVGGAGQWAGSWEAGCSGVPGAGQGAVRCACGGAGRLAW